MGDQIQAPLDQPNPLVSNPATDSLSSHSESAFALPTPSQLGAITVLKDVNEDKIYAWLAFARSLEDGFQYRNAAEGLSSPQFDAVSTLRDCSDSNVDSWLKYVALTGNVNLQHGVARSTSRSSTSPSPRHTRRVSARSNVRSSTSSRIPSIYSTTTSYSTPRSSTGYASSLPDLPEAAFEHGDLAHTHWCYECGKTVDSCDGWKRHMKEHETYFPCMPYGPVEDSGERPVCAFCGAANPDRDHLAEHRVSLCCSGSKNPTRKSRKSLMVSHLTQHGVFDTAASHLADKWQYKRNKQAFSCGFCVNYFPTIMEQLNHIDNEHYKSGQGTSSWNISTAIKGLLHQPKVYRYWRRLLASDSNLEEPDIWWDPDTAENLQAQLEVEGESGGDLALTAFGCRGGTGTRAAITIPVLQYMAVNPFSDAESSLSAPTRILTQNSTRESSPAVQQRPPVSRYQSNDSLIPVFNAGTAHKTNPPFHPPNEPPNPHIPSNWDDLAPWHSDLEISALDGLMHHHNPWNPNLGVSQPPDREHTNMQHASLHDYLNQSGAMPAAQPLQPGQLSTTALTSSIGPHQATVSFDQHCANSTYAPSLAAAMLDSANRIGSPNSWEKPLPALPALDEENAGALRPKSPMDIDQG